MKTKTWVIRSWTLGLCALICILGLPFTVETQNQPTTHPAEVRALNSIFQKWRISSAYQNLWNTSGEPCSGTAIDDSTDILDDSYNPFIKCDCSFDNNSTCHITKLKVRLLNVSGVIPDELWTFDFSFPSGADEKSLDRDIGHNALSGEVPKELGLLTDLRGLAIGTNNFSGPLPAELGNCLKLELLYIDSSGVSGQIPSTFANLQNMKIMYASNTELTGKMDFIGNWSKLENLRLQGNSFQGLIPSSFANLTSMKELRINGLSYGGSLAFIKNMKSLEVLDLRYNNISDTMPSTIGEYKNLTWLDLSFNSITGQIPDSLFRLSSLVYLSLGNNKLNGSLPSEKSPSLQNINLVANNFTIGQNNSVLPSGLKCLQRDFPCSRGTGIYSNFAINCGGAPFTSFDRTLFEWDDKTLGSASYYVTDTERWAVSNVGNFTGTNPQYKISSSSQFTNTKDQELFQTARTSASSLRYYGLGLQNGNYTVRLQFAETQITNTNTSTWESLGRRVFDIYIQGNRELEDFDIKKEAGGISNYAVIREFKAQVSENYLEIHLFWAGKGTCCIPLEAIYGPSISAISATLDLPTSKKSRVGLIVGIVVGVGVLGLVSVAAFWILRRRRTHMKDDQELLGIDAAHTFSYGELKAATEGFSPANKLGEGGFGPVYKGKLGDGRAIAVKQLSVASQQGNTQFVTEIATISAVQHRNLVKLYGCCIEANQRLLVYEFLENKSLDQILFGKKLNLSWSTRYDICLGVARGLAYLHEESRVRIVHRDVKASNILLDSDLIPKISDFGLAKLYDDKKTHISTRIAGTIGYLAPEYAMRGHLTEKTDVFAFGVVALEIVSGRLNSDLSLEEEQIYLLEWAWQLHENKQEVELVDSSLSEFNAEEVKRVIGIALLCTQTSPTQRPSMSHVVAMLSRDTEVSKVVAKPGYLTDWKFDDSSFMTSLASSYISNDTLTSTSTVADAEKLSENATKPLLVPTDGANS
ncbi:hypothetical protein CCACVL1_08461 [Corchorus capsularis]|uniref:non-specific serine/threonine protein kinase n=1 Tax=Corchorus capsularis TaxID=210143 RepID=A0A1R3J0I9_COCAP|nr:hypothetical protein CCACVL1_08461 [Corchorus capsularis]